MAMKMTKTFEKYWNVSNKMLAVASVLDPRRKLECLALFYELIYGDSYEVECGSIRDFLVQLVKDYESNIHEETSHVSHVSPSQTLNSNGKRPIEVVGSSEVVDLLVKHCQSKQPKIAKKCEVEEYLEEQRIFDNGHFDLLAWWSAQSIKYSTLSRIARDILAIPISTVASKSSFSTGG